MKLTIKKINLDPGLRRGDLRKVVITFTDNFHIMSYRRRPVSRPLGDGFLLLVMALSISLCTATTEKYIPREVLEIKNYDVTMTLNGRIKDELFIYNRVNTLRDDYEDTNEFIRHKLNIDFGLEQGKKKYSPPKAEGFVRLANYIYWQNNDHYMPFIFDQPNINNYNTTGASRNIHVKNLMPLIFAEQAWFKINFETFADCLKKRPTSLKVGFFPYTLGRGITLGYHDDVAVEALGWPGEGDFTRYPYMPPAILFNIELAKNLTADFYYSKWREVNATLEQTMAPVRQNRLYGPRPERGKGKDRDVCSIKADYITEPRKNELWHMQPYWLYVNAPEQTIEVEADASAQLHTFGMMVNIANDNLTANVECAGQCGHQDVHAIDRNAIENGEFTHIFLGGNTNRVQAPAGNIEQKSTSINYAKTESQLAYIVNLPQNRNLTQQGERLLNTNRGNLIIDPTTGEAKNVPSGGIQTYNSNLFNNKRFRSGYKLDYKGFMALADVAYEFTKYPLRIGGAVGHISGDDYPYNKEESRSFNGFIPLRSRYKGEAVKSVLIFDRLVIPRPMNISYKELYAFNHLKNLSDMEYVGLGLTWYPLEKRRTMSVTNDLMFFWKASGIHKWDKHGTYPDAAVEADATQINFDRDQLNFTGWESTEKAHRLLGAELDIKVLYQIIDQCAFLTKFCLFFPGPLYKDLDGQPNSATRRIDAMGKKHYDSLGHNTALGFICGLDYRF